MSETGAHVFLSYQRGDAHFSEQVRGYLQSHDFKVWYDRDIEPGEDWKVKIDEALRASFAVVVVLSPESVASQYVTYEWAFAMGLGVTIVPLMFRDCKPHPKLEPLNYLDFKDGKEEFNALNRRLEKLAKHHTARLNALHVQKRVHEDNPIRIIGQGQPTGDSEDTIPSDYLAPYLEPETLMPRIRAVGKLRKGTALGQLVELLDTTNLDVLVEALESLISISADNSISRAVQKLTELALDDSLYIEIKWLVFPLLVLTGNKHAQEIAKRAVEYEATSKFEEGSLVLEGMLSLVANRPSSVPEEVKDAVRASAVTWLILTKELASNELKAALDLKDRNMLAGCEISPRLRRAKSTLGELHKFTELEGWNKEFGHYVDLTLLLDQLEDLLAQP